MKRISEHTLEASREELAGALGFNGQVTMVSADETAMQYLIKVVGDPVAPAVVVAPPVQLPAPVQQPAPPSSMTLIAGNKLRLTVTFETTGDAVLMAAYAEDLKKEITLMLNRVPEPGVTATVALSQ